MKQLREQIKKELKTLMEKEMKYYPAPPEITNALVKDLKLNPLIRYVATLKAVNSVPPSYRVFFHNNQFIDLYIEQIGIKAVINYKSFWVGDIREANKAIQELNRVLTQPIPSSGETDDGETAGDEDEADAGSSSDTEMETEPSEEEEA